MVFSATLDEKTKIDIKKKLFDKKHKTLEI